MKTAFILLISLISSISATCQEDTLTRKQLDSLVSWIGFINTDLHDYDLLKKKSAAQEQEIKGLKEITRNQRAIDTRQSTKLENFTSTILNLQSSNFKLTNQLKTANKATFWSKAENWLWRGLALYLAGKHFKLY